MATKKKTQAPEKTFIRTVTYHFTGEIVRETDTEVVLTKAAWVADSGRFMQAMATGVFLEVEPYPDAFEVVVFKGAITDMVRNWPHALPREQK